MKMKNVFLVLFALILAVSFTGSALGATQTTDTNRTVEITYDVSDSYYIVVPAAIKINGLGSVIVTNATLTPTGSLTLSVDGGKHVEVDHRRMQHTGDGSDYLKYDIWYEVNSTAAIIQTPTMLGINAPIEIVNATWDVDTHLRTYVTHIQPKLCDGERLPSSGSFADTVKFTIRVINPYVPPASA